MESSHAFLESLPLDPLPRVDMENLVYNSIAERKLKGEEEIKRDDSIKDVINDEVSRITANIQADDFFSSLELQSSAKLSSNMLNLSFPSKLSSGVVTRSRLSSCTLHETCMLPRERRNSRLRRKKPEKKEGGKEESSWKSKKEKPGSGKRAKTKGKGRKVQSGKKSPADGGKDKVSAVAESKKPNKSEENVLEKSLVAEKSKDDEEWVLFNNLNSNLNSKKDLDEKMFESKTISNEMQNSVRRCSPELFPMNSILIDDGMSDGKDDVDSLFTAEDYEDSFLEQINAFTYAPPRSHTGGKWKPGSPSIRSSPLLWQSQNWDSFLEDRHQDDERKTRADTPADSPTESITEKSNKLPTTPSKWKDSTPPATHTGGKWKPIAPPPPTHTSAKWRTAAPPASFTGGKWKPSEFPHRPKKSDRGSLSPGDSEHNWKYDTERESDPPPTHTGGKWKPTSTHSTDLWKPSTSPLDLDPPTRGKWGSPPRKKPLHRSTLDVLAQSQSTSGKCLKTSGGVIQYYCSPCNRRLSSKKLYRKHAQSELHFKRVLQENELEFDSRSLKFFRGLFSQSGSRERGLGKRVIKKPDVFRSPDLRTSKREKKALGLVKVKGKRVARREVVQCEVCRVKVPRHQWGKHLVSYCHSKRIQLSDPDQQKLVLENIHAIVKQAPYQCGICKFYCNTHAAFKKHWALPVHEKAEESKNKRFWCALCSFETETCRSMELHLDSNSHREVILAVNKSIPIIIRHKVVFNCDVCSKEFKFNRELLRHKQIFHEKAAGDKKNKFTCSACEKSFKKLKSLQRHILNSHKGELKVSYFCGACNEFFDTREEAKIHRNGRNHKHKILANKTDNPSKVDFTRNCFYCSDTLDDLEKLKAHLLEKHPKLLPKCIRCGMTFALSQEVSRHVKNNECDLLRKDLPPPSPGSLCCDICSFNTKSKSEFLLHKAVHQKDKGERKIFCPICGSSYTQASLSVHLRTHLKERVYRCCICLKAFARKDRYVAHMKTKHGESKDSSESADDSGEKEDKQEEGKKTNGGTEKQEGEEESPEKRSPCGDPKCNYNPKDEDDLKTHVLLHVGPKTYKCPECPYTAKTNTIIKRHYMIHLDERSFPCHFCSFKARLKSHLKRHMRLHTGAKPYKCPHCPYTCNILENLRKHVLYTKIHPGKKLYECKQCVFKTNVLKDFKQHLLDNHKEMSKPADANEVAGIYNKEDDCTSNPSNPIPVKPRSSVPKEKASNRRLRKKAETLSQKYSPIAPKTSIFANQTASILPPSEKPAGTLVEDKRKILQMELEKLKKQIKPSQKKTPKSYPSPAEKNLKRKAKRASPRKKRPKKVVEEQWTTIPLASAPAEVQVGEVFLLNIVPTVVSLTEAFPPKDAIILPQVEFASTCILSEEVLPPQEMELYLLEDYQVL